MHASRWSHRSIAWAPVVALTTLAACGVARDEEPRGLESTGRNSSAVTAPRRIPRYAEPPRNADGSAAFATPRPARVGAPNQQLLFFGGRVISNVKVWAVNWTSNVNPAISSQIGAFYTAITASPWIDWLSEYDTIGVRAQDGSLGSDQRIGRGTFAGSVTITPTINTTNNITNDDIAAELAAQIAAGTLAPPETDGAGNVNSIYMFDFPAAVTITLYDGSVATSCVQYGAYHFTTRIGGLSVPYGVHPDCGGGFTSVTYVHSHELAEAITDTEVGLVNLDIGNGGGTTRPSAWYSYVNGQDNGEIADLCEGSPGGTVAGYSVTSLWSNTAGACIVTESTIICDGSSPAIPGCRACTAADDGNACNGAHPYCETDPSNVKFGQCVVCTASVDAGLQCPTAYPTCVQSSGLDDDTCANTGGCTSNAQCSGTTPFCDGGTHACRACVPSDCCGTAPLCSVWGVNQGQCVQCTDTDSSQCGGQTPVCDAYVNTCTQCMRDSDCPGSTCNLPAHTCAGGFDAGPFDGGGGASCMDAGNPIDSGTPVDAGFDSGNPVDAGIDAPGPVDAGSDAVAAVDAGTDAATPIDAGVDANAPVDASTPPVDAGRDGAASNDAGHPANDAGHPGGDAAPGSDAGSSTSSNDSGCSCRTGGASPSPARAGFATALLAVVLAARRRRRR
jgi:MYXO-CTERM domain-containing protein